MPKGLICTLSSPCENSLIPNFFFSKPAISLSEPVDTLIFTLNVFTVGEGEHGHQTITLLLPHVTVVDREALHSGH